MGPLLVISLNLKSRIAKINSILEKTDLRQNHPNMLWYGEEERLGIKVARQIIEHLNLKPYQKGGQGLVVVSADNFTEEAQSALLKALEEPPLEAVIILGASSEDDIIPTIQSRCQILNLDPGSTDDKLSEKDRLQLEQLMDWNTEQRFQSVEKLEDKVEFSKKLIAYFRQKLLENPAGFATVQPQGLEFLNKLLTAQKWAKQNVNPRAILEYLMLSMPTR